MKERLVAFQCQDWNTVNTLNRQIKNDITKAKLRYKDRIEQEFSSINTRQAYQKIKTLTGQAPSLGHKISTNAATFADSLNSFYTRFDTADHSALCDELLSALPPDAPSQPPFSVED
ncbi:hypothetical protein DPX16_20559, partial [Xyrichtys novacula]